MCIACSLGMKPIHLASVYKAGNAMEAMLQFGE